MHVSICLYRLYAPPISAGRTPKGVSRGIFSNEAGLGTGSIAHACADIDQPCKQGLFGIFEVFVDTIVICTLTALVILCGNETLSYGVAAGAELTIAGFVSTYGNWVSIFTAVALCCFAFSTVLGWGLYGSRCVEFVFGSRWVRFFLVIYSFVAIVGATVVRTADFSGSYTCLERKQEKLPTQSIIKVQQFKWSKNILETNMKRLPLGIVKMI